MGTYASDTSVPVDRSIAELRSTVMRYRATGFAFGEEADRAMVAFTAQDRRVRFLVTLPERTKFALTPSTQVRRTPAAQEDAWEKACRQRWRALNLVVKAKLEAVEAGIATFEQEFLGYLVLPGGQTMHEALQVDGRLQQALATGAAPSLLALPAAHGPSPDD